jgi:putative molybdopterin biosynthesis protein
MENIYSIQDFEQLKILADARRLTILRMLMAQAMTVSQLGQAMDMHPAQARHHLKQLEKAKLVELVDTRVVRGFVEKYYRARAQAFSLQELILPKSEDRRYIAIQGSHDLALETLARQLSSRAKSPIELLLLPTGSLEGLVALRQGAAHLAGCHLIDADSGEYNLPYIRHLFPDREIGVVTLAHREQGLIVAKDNPLQIKDMEDLGREDVTIINRNRGSGTRLWLDRKLFEMGLPVEAVQGYRRSVSTHTAVAEAVRRGTADAGLGLRASAARCGLGFIPLFDERFDLVLQKEDIQKKDYQSILDHLVSGRFRKDLAKLGGYQTGSTGDQLEP